MVRVAVGHRRLREQRLGVRVPWFRNLKARVRMTIATFLIAGAVLTGTPTWHDGDSGRLGGQRIRLDAIDAGELPGSPKCERSRTVWSCTPAARARAVEARERLRVLTIQGVTCRAEETDRYERVVVRCRLSDGRDPAAVLVREGLARPDLRYGGARYRGDELAARAARRGVWSRARER